MKSIWTALRDRHCPPAWAYFEEVRNGTGFVRKVTRSADALAFSLYPSRGLELHGFEVKVSRGDWLREKDDPNKAEEIARFCERWWLVTTKGCVNDLNEIPPSWGWMEFNGKLLVQRKAAPRMAVVQALDKPMIAAILRKASETQNARVHEAISEQVDERMAQEREAAKERDRKLAQSLAEAEDRSRRAQALIHQMEQATGQALFTDDYPRKMFEQLPPELVDLLKLARQADVADLRDQLKRTAEQLRGAAVSARWLLRQGGARAEKKTARGGWR